MKHSRSSAEWEIREALVAFLRYELPKARIIHEMNVDNGMNRADVTAVLPDRLFIFEIKSERDTLAHLAAQMKAFKACAHQCALVAHEKWFDRTPYGNGNPRMAFPSEHGSFTTWAYPCPQEGRGPGYGYQWRIPDDWRLGMAQPHSRRLLNLLWKQEMLDLGAALNVPGIKSRLNTDKIMQLLVWHCTGQQIARGVCEALRARPFAEADAPVGSAA